MATAYPLYSHPTAPGLARFLDADTMKIGSIEAAGTFKLAPLTTGSVPFIGASGLISQNNAKLFWDNTNYRLGIGTAAPAVALHVIISHTSAGTISHQNTHVSGFTSITAYDSAGTYRTSWGYGNASAGGQYQGKAFLDLNTGVDFYLGHGTSTRLSVLGDGKVGIGCTDPEWQVETSSDTQAGFAVATYGATPALAGVFYFNRGRGTRASASAVQTDDCLGSFAWSGQWGTHGSRSTAAAISGYAAENFTNTTTGGYLIIKTVPVGSTTQIERIRITAGGRVGLSCTDPDWTALEASSDTQCGLAVSTFAAAAASAITVHRSRGTRASRTAVQSGDSLGAFGWSGQWEPTVGYRNTGATLTAYATENWSGTVTGTDLVVSTVPNGTTGLVERARFLQSGSFRVGDSSNSCLVFSPGTYPLLGCNDSGGVRRSQWINDPATGGLILDYSGTAASKTGSFKIRSKPDTDANTVFYIDPDGKVGIGTVSPGYRLSVESSTALTACMSLKSTAADGFSAVRFFDNSSNAKAGWGYGNPGGLDTTTNGRMYFQVDSTSIDTVFSAFTGSNPSNLLMLIKGDGKVGIGTGSPAVVLHVAFAGGADSNVAVLSNTSATGYSAISIRASDNATEKLAVGYGNASVGAAVLQQKSYILFPVDLIISGSISTPRYDLYVKQSNGFVGVGTASPSGTLHVYDATASGVTTVKIQAGAGQASTVLCNIANAAQGGDTSLLYDSGSYSTGELLVRTSSDNRNVLALQNTSTTNSFSALVFRAGTDSIERGAVGWGNASAGAPFTSATYFESSYYTGSPHTTPPPPLLFVQTGYMASLYASRKRQEFTNDGYVNFYNLDGTTKDVVIDNINGRLGVGVVGPTAVLHLKAGTAAASTAPLKFTSGTLLTAPEVGAIEFLTDTFYGTITTGTERKAFAFAADVVPTGRTITAGAGLTGGGDLTADRTLTVGAGTGITVNVDDVAINQGFTPTWTGLHTFNLGTTPSPAILLDIADPGSGERSSHQLQWKAWSYPSAAAAHLWTADVLVASSTPVNSLWRLRLSYDGGAAETMLLLGLRDTAPKAILEGPNQDFLVRPGTRTGTDEAGRDLYLKAGKKTGAGAEGGIWIAEAAQKLGFFDVAPIVRVSAYTQTYSTASKTHSNFTAASLTDSTGGTAGATIAKAETAMGELNFNANATATVITTADTYTIVRPVTGTYSQTVQFSGSPGSNCRLKYTGTNTRMFHCGCTISVLGAASSDVVEFVLVKNGTVNGSEEYSTGTILSAGTVRFKLANAGDQASTAIHIMVELAQNDYLELFVKNVTDTDDLTITNVNMFAMAVPDVELNNDLASLTSQVNKLIDDLANAKQVINSLIDDGQAYGLLP